jgi:hypothetical protein
VGCQSRSSTICRRSPSASCAGHLDRGDVIGRTRSSRCRPAQERPARAPFGGAQASQRVLHRAHLDSGWTRARRGTLNATGVWAFRQRESLRKRGDRCKVFRPPPTAGYRRRCRCRCLRALQRLRIAARRRALVKRKCFLRRAISLPPGGPLRPRPPQRSTRKRAPRCRR